VDRRFWLPVDHATELAHRALEQLGWTLTSGHDWQLAWTLDLPGADTFGAASAGRWVNHLRGIATLSVKSHLCHTLRQAAGRAADAGAASLYGFVPQTFVLPAEWDEWTRARKWDPDAVWIQKPADLSRGRGVALVNQPNEVRGGNLVVQRYIANPHLLDGYKYSLRFYVLILSAEPLIAYLFEDGFTKLASRPFSLAAADRADRFRHLTNPDVLRDDPDAVGVSSRNSTHRQYRQRLRQMGIDDAAVFARIERAMAATLMAAQPGLRAIEQAAGGSGRGQFELLGIDVALDEHLQPWLLECNLAPSLSVEASAETAASRDESALKTQVVADTLRMIGADDEGGPGMPPANGDEARARLAWHDRRRGGFERLWPSPTALEVLTGVEPLGEMDRALLADEAAGGWPRTRVNAVDTVDLGDQRILFEPARDRITLLDANERESWSTLTAGSPPAVLHPTAASHGVEWLRDGLLLPASVAGPSSPAATHALRDRTPKRRHRWNLERVYSVHGLRVALRAATPRQASTLDQALAWWDASDEDTVDTTLFVPWHATPAEVLGHLDRLALRRIGGIVRRRLTYATRGAQQVLIIGDSPEVRRRLGEDWTFVTRHTVIGGSPFGAWIDRDGGLEPVPVSAIDASRRSRGDVMLDLVSAGPGVVYSFDAASVRALAAWLESLPIAGV